MSESNNVLGANAVLAGTELRNAELRNRIIEGVNLTLNAINECLENAECVQDIEKCVEQQKVLYNIYKEGICEERGFTIEECNNIIKKFNIEEVEWDKVDEIIEAKKIDIIEKNLEIFEDISYEECWANRARLCINEDEFNAYLKDLITDEYTFDEETSKWEDMGYYDYNLTGYVVRVAGLDYVFTEDLEMEISLMDEPIKAIRARVLDSQIEAYMEYLGLKRYEYTMNFKSKQHIDGIDRLDSFLKEMRKRAFVFHDKVEQKYTREEIENFSFVYYIEEDKQEDLDFEIINSYEHGMEDVINLGRTI